jgi:hypothetical protein
MIDVMTIAQSRVFGFMSAPSPFASRHA